LLTVPVPTEVRIEMTSSAFTPWISLMSSDGTPIYGFLSPVQRVLNPGQYIISAEHQGGEPDVTGSYTLSVLGPCHYASTIAMPAIAAAPNTLGGALATSDCRFPDGTFADAITVTVPTGGATVTIGLSAAFDTYMQLADQNGKVIYANDDLAPGNLNSQITATLTGGTWTIWASSFGAAQVGSYTLSLFRSN
jgi:hypothetical protein